MLDLIPSRAPSVQLAVQDCSRTSTAFVCVQLDFGCHVCLLQFHVFVQAFMSTCVPVYVCANVCPCLCVGAVGRTDWLFVQAGVWKHYLDPPSRGLWSGGGSSGQHPALISGPRAVQPPFHFFFPAGRPVDPVIPAAEFSSTLSSVDTTWYGSSHTATLPHGIGVLTWHHYHMGSHGISVTWQC